MGQHSQKSPLSLSTWADRLDLQFLGFSHLLHQNKAHMIANMIHCKTQQHNNDAKELPKHTPQRNNNEKGCFLSSIFGYSGGCLYVPLWDSPPFFLCFVFMGVLVFLFVCLLSSLSFVFFGFSSFVEGAVLFWFLHVKLSNKKTDSCKKSRYLQQTHRRMERRSGGRMEWRKDGGARKQASEQTEWLAFVWQEVPHKNWNPKIITRWKIMFDKKINDWLNFRLTHTHMHTRTHTLEAPPQHNCHQHQNNLILVKQWRTNTCNNTIIKPTNT